MKGDIDTLEAAVTRVGDILCRIEDLLEKIIYEMPRIKDDE